MIRPDLDLSDSDGAVFLFSFSSICISFRGFPALSDVGGAQKLIWRARRKMLSDFRKADFRANSSGSRSTANAAVEPWLLEFCASFRIFLLFCKKRDRFFAFIFLLGAANGGAFSDICLAEGRPLKKARGNIVSLEKSLWRHYVTVLPVCC